MIDLEDQPVVSALFSVKDLPEDARRAISGMKARPKTVEVFFYENEVRISGMWRAYSDVGGPDCSVLFQKDSLNWTGSDGEPNVTVKESWSGPIVTRTDTRKLAVCRVHIGNLRELCPVNPSDLTKDQLNALWEASITTITPRTEITVSTYVLPGPFNSLKEAKRLTSGTMPIFTQAPGEQARAAQTLKESIAAAAAVGIWAGDNL